jgi:uncharacterized membrane protein YphA (DoxX/SURF4 family)
MDKAKSIGTWVMIVLLSAMMLMGGVMKLMGNPMVHESFATMGLPAWFGYFIGLAEVAGAVGLYLRFTSAWAAGGLLIIMLGAVYYHVVYSVPSAIPALVFAVFAVLIVLERRKNAWLPTAKVA